MAKIRGSDADRCQRNLPAVTSASDLLSLSLSFPLCKTGVIISVSQTVGSTNLIYVKHLWPFLAQQFADIGNQSSCHEFITDGGKGLLKF